MTQLVLNIENPSTVKALKELVKHMTGVKIARTPRRRKNGFELAMEDVEAGRVTEYSSVEDLIKAAKQ